MVVFSAAETSATKTSLKTHFWLCDSTDRRSGKRRSRRRQSWRTARSPSDCWFCPCSPSACPPRIDIGPHFRVSISLAEAVTYWIFFIWSIYWPSEWQPLPTSPEGCSSLRLTACCSRCGSSQCLACSGGGARSRGPSWRRHGISGCLHWSRNYNQLNGDYYILKVSFKRACRSLTNIKVILLTNEDSVMSPVGDRVPSSFCLVASKSFNSLSLIMPGRLQYWMKVTLSSSRLSLCDATLD